jgi:hypothetical protein
MTKIIKLIDENLIGQPGLSMYIDPKTNWEREPENYDVGIYVDRMCFVIPKDETKINCAWLIEPPIINGENYQNIIKNKENFKYIFTHHKNLLNQSENVVYVPHGGTWMREDDINVHDKSKMVSCIFSYKNWNPYHRMRFRVYDRLKDDSRVDFYGSGCEKPIEYKTEALKDYMFSIVIENSIESDYFTEKILDCFLSGTIPIYVGSKTTSQYFDENGIIYFEGDEDLPSILEKLNVELYMSKLESVKKNFELAKEYMFPEKLIQNFLNQNVQ